VVAAVAVEVVAPAEKLVLREAEPEPVAAAEPVAAVEKMD
jgi:hypothetical protein